MVDVADILRFVDAVAAEVRPQRVILFGSYAYGAPTTDSDVDVLVVMNYRGPNHRHAVRVRRAGAANFPMDVLVRSQAEIARRVAGNDFFLDEITREGLVLYDRDDPGVGDKGRRRLRRRFAARAVA